MDVLMPIMDGFETAWLIRQRDASKDIPIIFLTATDTDVANIYKAYSVGAVDYLVKPVDTNILRAKVAVFVDLYRKGQRIRNQDAQLREKERLLSAEALRESETLYEATFNASAVAIGSCATDGRFLRANQQLCDTLGRSREQVLQLRVQDVSHPEDSPELVSDLHRLLAEGVDSSRRESRCLRGDGQVFWATLAVSLLRDVAGKPKHFIVALEDVTERRLADERQSFLATASEQLLSSLDYEATLKKVARLAAATVADFCAIDLVAEGQVQELVIAHRDPARANAFQKLRFRLPGALEWDQAAASPELKLVSLGPQELLDPETTRLVEQLDLRSVIRVPLVARDRLLGSLAFWRTNGSGPYGETDLRMAEDLAHRAAFAIENARLYREAQDAVGARDEFLSIASHELRTPLTPLQLSMQRLLASRNGIQPLEQLTTDELRRSLVRWDKQVRRLSHLIDNLLDVSRISAGRLDLKPEAVDLVEVAREIVARLWGDVPSAESPATVLAETGPVVGLWDRLRVEQVVTNLLANAMKYGGGKPVTVTVSRNERFACFEVRDQGIGIAAEKQAKIFERFERAVSSRVYGGLGLGLYIARQIVDAHGGMLEVSSNPGRGSVFTMQLPIGATILLPAQEQPAQLQAG
jgi:PAS domain S-box-containing protein